MVKYSKLFFCILTILGSSFLAFIFISIYWSRTSAIEILTIEALIPKASQSNLAWFSLLGGGGFLTVGISGLVRHFVKAKNAFTVLAVFMVPLLIFACFSVFVIGVGPMDRMAITHVSLDNNSPLILAFSVKSFSSGEIYFDEAYVNDSGHNTVARIYGELHTIGRLPSGSEQALTFNFNTTLPPGDYTAWLRTRVAGNTYSSSFTIPNL